MGCVIAKERIVPGVAFLTSASQVAQARIPLSGKLVEFWRPQISFASVVFNQKEKNA